MSTDPRDEPEDLARLLDQLAPLEARAKFRASLREQFLANDPEPALSAALDAWQITPPSAQLEAAQRAAFVPREASPAKRRPRLHSRRLLIAGALAAAASIAFILWPRVPRWELVPGSYTAAALTIDGENLAGRDHVAVAERVARARVVQTSDSGLRMRFGRRFVLEIGDESHLELPVDPRGDSLMLSAKRGSFRVATGPEFRGMHLAFETEQLEAHVAGTIFAVDVNDRGSCVCCTRGRVRVETKVGDSDAGYVEMMRAAFVTLAGERHAHAVIPNHAKPLTALEEFWR